ncbi:uncharacterized protein ASCRUDRAFT_24549, partial [Ascoidea rubescens DSM 1968]
ALYVGDLDENVTEKLLFDVFSKHAAVTSVKICFDSNNKKSLGYGYVNFINSDEASIAKEKLNYTHLLNKEIRIMESMRHSFQNMKGSNVYFKNLPEVLSTREFYEIFKPFGEILSCKVEHSKSYGFINFQDFNVAQSVVDNFNGSTIKGSKLFVGLHTPKEVREKEKKDTINQIPTIYVRNLPIDINDDQLKSLFGKFGAITSTFVKPVFKLKASWAFVTFKSHKSVLAAINFLNDTEYEGKRI